MHTIKLKVKDSVYEHVICLLKSLNKQELEIIEDNKISENDEESSIDFSKYNIKAFQDIEDPVKWQRDIRVEWDR
ncbi:MAG: hypothetical protein HQL46_16570 [Gammaproteobacteria bacterium]|nr:hypothetical protein [Gammaproteobacteria bacterium]